jgi:MFS family permease
MNVSGRALLFIVSVNVAQLPVAMQSLLLVLLGHHNTGSYAIAGAAAAAAAVGFGVTAPILGRMVGRFGHRPVLLITGAASLLAHVGLALSRAPTQFVVVAAVLGLVTPPAMSSARALLAETMPMSALSRAYAVNAVAQELVYVTGPLWVTLWIAVSGPVGALLSGAVLGALALVVAVALIPAHRHPVQERPAGSAVLARAGLRTLVTVNLGYMVCMGAMWVLVPAFATQAGHPDRAGLLIAVWSLGSVAGGVALAALRRRLPLRPAYLVLLGLLVVSSVPLALSVSLWQFGIVLAAFGLGLAPWLAVSDGLLARIAPPPRTGEAYGWMVTAGQAGTAIGSTVAGVIADQQAAGASFLFVTVALLAALIVAATRRRTLVFPADESDTSHRALA